MLVRWNSDHDAPRREFDALASIAARGVPRALTFIRGPQASALVSTWVQGVCPDRLDRTRLERCAQQIAEVLAYSHRSGWVHGDVKPSNIVETAEGDFSLVDWEGAARIGDPAVHGTLGYSPAWAWSENLLAAPERDWYALAVTLVELSTGRRVFSGTASEILQAQSNWAPEGISDLPPIARTIVRQATTGKYEFDTGVGAPRKDERSPTNPESVAAIYIHSKLSAKLSVASTALDVDASPGDRIAVERAAMALLVGRFHRPTLTWSDLRLAFDASVEDSRSHLDALRDNLARTVRAALIWAKETGGTLVRAGFADEDSFDGWPELVALARLGDPIVMLELRLRPSQESVPREALRHILSVTHGTVAIGPSALERAAQLRFRSCTDAAAQCWAVPLAGDGDGPSIGRLSERIEPTRSTLSSELSTADELSHWLSVGERAAIRGRQADLYKAAIRASSLLIAGTDVEAAVVLRLADLWTECGRPESALEVLGSALSEVRGSLMLARSRILCSIGMIDEAARLVADSTLERELKRDSSDAAELQRLRAVVALAQDQPDRALGHLREALATRKRISASTLCWLLVTLGNVLRITGRGNSARRVLRIAVQLADRLGSVRLSIAASGNMLNVKSDSLVAAQVAADASALAEQCRIWGMRKENWTLSLTGASWWLIAREPTNACNVLNSVMPSSQASARDLQLLRLLDSRAREARDLAEQWSDIRRQAELCDSTPQGTMEWLHRHLLSLELGRAACERVPRQVAACREYRAYRVALHALRSDGASARVARTLQVIAEEVAVESPVFGHIGRALVRYALTREATHALAEAVLRGLNGSAGVFLRAVGFQLIVRSPLVNLRLVEALRDAANGDARARPPGMRRWEWQLVSVRISAQLEIACQGGWTIDSVLDSVEEQLRSADTHEAVRELAQVPLQIIASTLGVQDLIRDGDLTAPGATAGLTAFRAWLSRRGAAAGPLAMRVRGLERVLQCALTMRSSVDLDQLLVEVASGVLSVCRAERAVVIHDVAGSRPRGKLAAEGRVRDIDAGDAEVSRTAIARARATGRACIVDDACGDDDLGDRPSVLQYRPKSLIVAPLMAHGRALGYVYVENRSIPKSFCVSDVELIEGFAAQAALALDNAQLVAELRESCVNLERARGEAIRAESLRVLGRMASEVAHDFNNLLTAILGETQLLLEDARSDEVRRALAVIETAAMDGATAIRRIQDSTRVRTDREFESVDLTAAVEEAASMTRVKGRNCGVEVTLECGGGRIWIRGVAGEVREVLTNIIINAIEASPYGVGAVVRIGLEQVEGTAVVTIEDRGCGMSPEIMAKIFDPFFSTKGVNGNGLGLSIAYGIVKRHGGHIDVSSAVGVGTTMRVLLPCAPIEDAPEFITGGARREHSYVGRRVLVVDDEPSVARILVAMLTKLGWDAEAAYGGRAAIERFDSDADRYDLVITDLNMPDIDGLAVVERVSAKLGGSSVILMTGSLGSRPCSDRSGLAGIRMLRKPFSLDDVAKLMAS